MTNLLLLDRPNEMKFLFGNCTECLAAAAMHSSGLNGTGRKYVMVVVLVVLTGEIPNGSEVT